MSGKHELWYDVLREPVQRNRYSKLVEEIDAKIGSFLSFNPDDPEGRPIREGPLSGIPMAIKDNIAVKGRPLTCGSKLLRNLVAPYTSTAVDRLEKAGAVVVGKTNMDEFGMGSSNEHSALATTVNPWDYTRVPGGSSGGSAAAVAAGLVPLSLGSDTGGSVRQPANFCGVYGLKPTYGTVSRYGLTAYASSLEVIGCMSADIDLLERAFNIMSSRDNRDQSTLSPVKPKIHHKKAVLLEFEHDILDAAIADSYKRAAEALENTGVTLSTVRLSSFDFIVPAYYTIATAEASANLARYNGIRYGYTPDYAENPVELMRKARHEGFGDEVKLRVLLGTYVLRSGFQKEYYGKAQRIRTLIRNELNEVFKNNSLMLMPVFPTQAFPRGEKGMDDYQQRLADVFTCLANLAGLPALSIPTGNTLGLPTGVQLMTPAFAESHLFQAARSFQDAFPLISAPGSLEIESLL